MLETWGRTLHKPLSTPVQCVCYTSVIMSTMSYLSTGLAVLVILLNTSIPHGSALEDCNLDIVNKTTGLVKSPNYGFGYGSLTPFNCYWRITIQPGHRIRVVFHSPFDIDDLGYHFLHIYDGPEAQPSRQLYKLNGDKLPEPFTTTGNSLYVVFKARWTSFYIGGKGFSFTFTDYGDTIITLPEADEGVVANVRFPDTYLPNEVYGWQLSVPPGLDILLKFTDWSLINGDRLNIYSGESANESRIVWGLTKINIDPRYGRPPETTMPDIFVPGNKAYLTLKTYHNGRFAINYRGVSRTVCPSINSPDHGYVLAPSVLRINSTATFSCDNGYKLLGPPSLTCVPDEESQTTPFWDKEIPTCIESTECGYNIFIETGFGVLTSPGYPNSYSPDVDCSWYIYTNPNYQIEITFSSPFGIAYGESALDIHNGGTKQSIRLARLTGDLLPIVPVSSGNELLIHFRGNGSSSGAGFSLTYNVSAHEIARCGETFTNVLNGTLVSPNYPGELKRNIGCDWMITVPEGYNIQLIPTAFNYDYDNTPIRVIHSESKWKVRFRKQFLGFTNRMKITLNTAELDSAQPAFILTFLAIPQQTAIGDAREGILQTPNYPESSAPDVEFWWNLTAPARHRLTFQTVGKYSVHVSVLSFHEYIDGNWTTIGSISGKLSRSDTISVESYTESVYIKLKTVDSSFVQIHYQAFPSTQCPPLLMPDVDIVTSGFSPGDQANVSCGRGHSLTGPSQLTCVLVNNTYNQAIPQWDRQDVTCKDDYCSLMLHELNSTYGYVQSLGYPAMVRFALTCQIPLTAPDGYLLAIRFTGARLPFSTPVILKEGGFTRYELKPREQPIIYQSTSSNVLAYFKTQGYNGQGFRFVYQAFPTGSQSPWLKDASLCPHPGNLKGVNYDSDKISFQIGDTINYTCPPGTLLIGSSVLTCVNTSVDVAIWDETPPFCSEASYSKCNRTITSGSGLLSPMRMNDFEPCAGMSSWYCGSNGGDYYVNSQDCRTYFDVPEGYIVLLENSKYIDVIKRDYLLIYDGLSIDDTLLFNLTYTTIQAQPETEFPNQNFNSRSNKLLVRFTSDADSGSRGYTIKYSVIPADGCVDPPNYPRYGWLQTAQQTGPYHNGARARYGCMETFNRTGEFRECNGTSHQWTGSNSICLASPYYERTIGVPTSLYTPSYPDYYFRISQGSWNFTAPSGSGIELFIKPSCRMSDWDDGFHIYDKGVQVAQKVVQNSWYVTNVLNTDPLEVLRIPSNRLIISFSASFWRASNGKCEIKLKAYELPPSCDSPLPGRHRRLVGGSHRVGHSLQLICNEGFYLPDGSSSTSSRCEPDLKWTPEILDCEAPCGDNLTASEGLIYSPGFPHLYPFGQDCVWTIDAPIGTIISLNFTLFDLRRGQYDYHDEVSLRESSGQWLFKKYRSNHNGLFKLSQTNSVILNLTSSTSRTIQKVEGLKVIYKAYRPYKCEILKEVPFLERREITPYPDNDTVKVEYFCQYPFFMIGSPVITCLPDGQWDNPEPRCAGVCGGDSNRESGAILSPGYPDVVTSPESCTWHLAGAGTRGTGIRLELQNVTLANDDILEVYDGDINKEKPTYYTWQSLPMSLCGTALQMNIRLVPKGANSSQLTFGTIASCTESSDCQCRRTEEGCLKCHQPTDISVLRQCLENSGVIDMVESETELNCTILALARALGQLFGGTVTGVDLSHNCTQFSNTTSLSPAVLQCLETSALKPCIQCRTSQPNIQSRFRITFTADVRLKKCQKSDLIIPQMERVVYMSGNQDAVEVGAFGNVACQAGLVLSGTEMNRVMCSHSGRWGVTGLECTCNRVYDKYPSGTITTMSGSISYHNNLHCTYNVKVQEGLIIRLRFRSAFIEPRDTLVIYDGNKTSDVILRELENITRPPIDVFSSGSQLLMVFTSDSSGTSAGFTIAYTSLSVACDTSQWGSIQLTSARPQVSLRLGDKYRDKSICTWVIMAPPTTVIKISAEKPGSVVSRVVQLGIYEGDTIFDSTIRTVRNRTDILPDPYYSHVSTIWFRLTLFEYTRLDITLNFKAQVKCPKPSDPANGQIVNTDTSFAHGDVLSTVCKQGYELSSQSELTCFDMGESLMWSGSMPVCNRIVDPPKSSSTTKVTTGVTSVIINSTVSSTLSSTPLQSTTAQQPVIILSEPTINPPSPTDPNSGQPEQKGAVGQASSASSLQLSFAFTITLSLLLFI